ncbi:MAG: hypothetical protein IIY81_06150 [Lachnospiraceae bacterium]|nr:hypothetical protein [Lachnospiraceae bacterium]
MNHTMFRGLKEVFGFTFEQNVKAKSFKVALIVGSVLLFTVFFGINMGIGAYKDSKADKKDKKNRESQIEKMVFVNETDLKEFDVSDFHEYHPYIKNLEIEVLDHKDDIKSEIEQAEENNTAVMSVLLLQNSKNNTYEIRLDYSSACKKSNVTRIANYFEEFFEESKFEIAGISEVDMELIRSDSFVTSTDVEEADKSLTQILLEVFIPMLSVLLIYMLVLLYGQSVSKILVVEKNSKLMENLLISVKPYGIVAGKVIAMYVIAMIEIIMWILSGFAGYYVGNKIAKNAFEHYSNPINVVVGMFRDNMSTAFSTSAAIAGILSLLIGLLLYFVLSALVSSNITKAEDLANGTGVYQVIVVIGYLVSYFLPLTQGNSSLVKIVRYIPLTAAFMLPSDVLIGNISVIGTAIANGLMVVTTVIMIIITGRIYKKKLF